MANSPPSPTLNAKYFLAKKRSIFSFSRILTGERGVEEWHEYRVSGRNELSRKKYFF